MFDALRTTCRTDGYRGCAFINTAAEAAPGSDVHARTVAHKAAVRAWVRDLAAQARATHPDALAARPGPAARRLAPGDPRGGTSVVRCGGAQYPAGTAPGSRMALGRGGGCEACHACQSSTATTQPKIASATAASAEGKRNSTNVAAAVMAVT